MSNAEGVINKKECSPFARTWDHTHSIGGIDVAHCFSFQCCVFLFVSFVSVMCLMPNIASVSLLTILDFPDNAIARKDMISPFLFGSSYWQCFCSFVLLNLCALFFYPVRVPLIKSSDLRSANSTYPIRDMLDKTTLKQGKHKIIDITKNRNHSHASTVSSS